MTTFEIVINCILAAGALATAGAFIYVIRGQKGTQKQIDSLSQMATTFTSHYQIARIQAGNNVYPRLAISLKHDIVWGMKIWIKNNSYPVEIYRIIVSNGSDYSDIKITPREDYIAVRQGESKKILPGEISRHHIYGSCTNSIRLFVITPFEEAYEIRYSDDGDNESYQSEAIPILYSEEEHESGTQPTITVKSYSIHGNIPGTLEDNFSKLMEDSDE